MVPLRLRMPSIASSGMRKVRNTAARGSQRLAPPRRLLHTEYVHGRYGWRLDEQGREHDRPVLVSDLDGTLRGDVGPMVRMATLLVPRFLRKVMLQEPLRARKVARFVWGLGRLWVLRTLHREHRRRYKYLFSELHTLAASLLSGTSIDQLREMYRQSLPVCGELWYPQSIELLRRLTSHAHVVLITGSEQIQTEECVQLLKHHGINTSRIHVHGSLYEVDPDSGIFTGGITHLNVTLDGKRESLAPYTDHTAQPFAASFGNSRPDRALFDATHHCGLRVLVCRRSVIARRKRSTFVIRKLLRHGYSVVWTATEYLRRHTEPPATETDRESRDGLTDALPILLTDHQFQPLLSQGGLADNYSFLVTPQTDAAPHDTHSATPAAVTLN